MLQVVKTTHSVFPWRLRTAAGPFVPHAACRTKREALALKADLDALVDWTQPPETWPAEAREAVLARLAQTASAQIQHAAQGRWR